MVFNWGQWAVASGDAVRAARHRAAVQAVQNFPERDAYLYSAEAVAARQPGRQSLETFQRCAKKLLAKLALPKSKGGKGIRLTYEQV